jgi:glycosyltransferase involved in cell wall biosynthesis
MADVDWVVVPSIWYENSPLVIQEAFAIGRPVIATDFGAMREKVTNDVTGLTVPRGNPHAWGDVMLRVSKDPKLWDRLYAALPTPLSLSDCAVAHLEMIGTLKRGEK